MSIRTAIASGLARLTVAIAGPAPTEETPKEPARAFTSAGIDKIGPSARDLVKPEPVAWGLPKPAPGVIPRDDMMAQDAAIAPNFSYMQEMQGGEGYQFMGFARLSELAQIPEYRRPSEIIAKEMTRKWIKVTSSGNEDKSEKIKIIEAALKKFDVQGVLRRMVEHDGFFGRAQMFIDLGADEGAELTIPLTISPAKIGRNSLRRFRTVEPIWTYPNDYNSDNPLAADFYRPATWFVMGQKVHKTRLLTMVSREVPDMLKPAYAFGGLSLTQMMRPYVENWIRTRQSVSDLIQAFTVFVLSSNMAATMEADGEAGLIARVEAFNRFRDNRGTMVIDKDSEEFSNVTAPIAGLDELQAQSQEHMSAPNGVPLVKLFGITPSGLNASSDGEIRCFYDWIHASQEHDFDPLLKVIFEVIQLSELGEIDPDIGWEYVPLWQMDEEERATVEKTRAETDAALIAAGVILPEEVRAKMAGDTDSPYHGIDPAEVPEPMPDPAEESDPADGQEDLGGGQDVSIQQPNPHVLAPKIGAYLTAPKSSGAGNV